MTAMKTATKTITQSNIKTTSKTTTQLVSKMTKKTSTNTTRKATTKALVLLSPHLKRLSSVLFTVFKIHVYIVFFVKISVKTPYMSYGGGLITTGF